MARAPKTPKPPKVPATRRRTMVTPEGVDLGVELATAGSRLSAFIIDLVILIAVVIAFSLVVAGAGWASDRETPGANEIVGLLGFFLLRNVWFIGWELRPGGATPGKRLMKIRVASRNGGRLAADAVFARNVTREFELFLPMTFVVGGLGAAYGLAGLAGGLAMLGGLVWSLIFLCMPLFNRDRLRAGDLIGGTWVVEAPKAKLLPDLAREGAERLDRFPFTPEQVDAYGVMELHVLEDVMRRRDVKVIGEVARRIRTKIGWTPVDGEKDDEFLSAYYAALRRRLEQRLLFGHRRKDKHDRP